MTIEVDVERQLGAFHVRAQFAGEPGVTALFGRSGAGKSSIINMISGLLKPDRGRIAVDGRVLFDHEQRINLPPRKRRIGYIFQESRLFPHLKVRRNLLYGRRFTPAGEHYVELDRIVDMLGIEHLLERRPPMLSGGERQRVAIGRALLASPRLLLMDEPLASLDAQRKNEILPYIERLRDELQLPIVYVSHQFEDVARLADRLVIMDNGTPVAAGPLAEVVNHLDLSRLAGLDLAGAIVEAKVAGHDDVFGLTRLVCPGGHLLVPMTGHANGALVRVRIRTADVSIATRPPTDISVQNVLSARIDEISDEPGASATLRLDAAGTCIMARITRKSVQELDLAPGRAVYALIKSAAIDGRDLEHHPSEAIARGVPRQA